MSAAIRCINLEMLINNHLPARLAHMMEGRRDINLANAIYDVCPLGLPRDLDVDMLRQILHKYLKPMPSGISFLENVGDHTYTQIVGHYQKICQEREL